MYLVSMKSVSLLSLLSAIIAGVWLLSCKNEKQPGMVVKPRDTTINVTNSYTELFFDSTAMENFVSKEAMADSLANRIRSFYNGRNYQYAWFDSTGIAEYAHSFLNMQSQYIDYARDSS